MKCSNCNKEIPTGYFDDTPGAVFVVKDSDSSYNNIWPAIWGVKKYEGCVEFGCGIDSLSIDDSDSDSLILTDEKCDEVYFDHPERGEAWLVEPIEGGYDWTPVSNRIVFSHKEE